MSILKHHISLRLNDEEYAIIDAIIKRKKVNKTDAIRICINLVRFISEFSVIPPIKTKEDQTENYPSAGPGPDQ